MQFDDAHNLFCLFTEVQVILYITVNMYHISCCSCKKNYRIAIHVYCHSKSNLVCIIP